MRAADLAASSPRLLRAVRAEHAELTARRARLQERRARLVAELAEVEDALSALGERAELLVRLAPPDHEAAAADPHGTPDRCEGSGDAADPHSAQDRREGLADTHAAADARGGPGDAAALRGTAVREAAVRVLAHSPDDRGAVHYRRWYDLLRAAGHEVAGKDPLAVFLTQISRSPVVRRSTTAGVYELDDAAPERLRRELAALQAQLRELTGAPVDASGLADARRRREATIAAIARTERRLEEALRCLGPALRQAGDRRPAIISS
jgi:hypothetical protein